MQYFFEFKTLSVKNKYCDRFDDNHYLYVWMIDDNDRSLLFKIDVYYTAVCDCIEYIEMYQSVKNGLWRNMDCRICLPDYAAQCHIDTYTDDTGKKFVIISEYCNVGNDQKDGAFQLTLPWDKCNQQSFIDFLRELVMHNVPKLCDQDENEQYDEYINVCKKYGMYMPIDKTLVEKLLK